MNLSESEDSEDEVPPNPAAELSMAVDPSEFSTAFSHSAAARWLNNYPDTQAEMDKIVKAEAHQEDFYTPPSTPRAVLSARADADRAAVRRLGQEHEDWTKRAAAGAARLKAAIKSDASSSWQPSQRGPPKYGTCDAAPDVPSIRLGAAPQEATHSRRRSRGHEFQVHPRRSGP